MFEDSVKEIQDSSFEEGVERGKLLAHLEVSAKMIKRGFSHQSINEITELPLEKIKTIDLLISDGELK